MKRHGPPKRPITARDLRFAQSPRGGFSKAQLEALGIRWTPRSGTWWCGFLLGKWFTIEQIAEFRELSDKRKTYDQPYIGIDKWHKGKTRMSARRLLEGLCTGGYFSREQIEALGEEWFKTDVDHWINILMGKEVTRRQASLFQALCDEER